MTLAWCARWFPAIGIAGLAASCAVREEPVSLSPEDYAVYAAILEHHAHDMVGTGGIRYRFVLIDSTQSSHENMRLFSTKDAPAYGRILGQSQALEEAARDLEFQARRDTRLEAHFPGPSEYVLLPQAQLKSILRPRRRGRWATLDSLYAPDPPGFFSLSRIGYSRDRLGALVYCANRCGHLCGRGSYWFLTKTEGAWRVAFQPGSRWKS